MKLAITLAAGLALAGAARADAIDDIFAPYAKAAAPGCAVGVARSGQPTVLRGYGTADLENDIAVTPETVFEAGSVSKQFTAAAVLTLVNDGKLALGDDIRKYLPEMPDYGTPITVDMLLSHTSGLRDWGEVAALGGWPRGSRAYTNTEALQITARQKALNYRPGEAWSYTNTGYNLLAVIVQRVSGQSLADFTRDRLFKPLGMAHTAWRDDYRRVVAHRAQAYEPSAAGWLLDMPFEDIYGNGGLLTTVGDLLTWNDALTGHRIGAGVTERMEQVAVLTSGRKTGYGRGLFQQTYRGVAEIAHDGATAGYRAVSVRYPGQGLTVAILCNAGNANPGALGHRVADLYLPPAPAAATPPPVAAAPAGELQRHVGSYLQLGPAQVLRVVVEGDHLRFPGGPLITWAGDGTYRIGTTKVEFKTNGDMATTDADGEVTLRPLVTPAVPTPAELAALSGTYASDETGATLKVGVKGAFLTLTPGDRPSSVSIASAIGKDLYTRPGGVMRVIRGKGGKVEALSFNGGRVWDLRYRRVAG